MHKSNRHKIIIRVRDGTANESVLSMYQFKTHQIEARHSARKLTLERKSHRTMAGDTRPLDRPATGGTSGGTTGGNPGGDSTNTDGSQQGQDQ